MFKTRDVYNCTFMHNMHCIYGQSVFMWVQFNGNFCFFEKFFQILKNDLGKYLVKSKKPRFWMNKYEWFTALYLFDTGFLVFNHALLHINSDRLSLREKNWVLVLYI